VPVRRLTSAATVTAAAALVTLAGCGSSENFGAPKGATKQGRRINHLYNGLVIAGIVVFAIIWLLVLWSVVRYRRRKHDEAGALPVQTRGNMPLEVALTALPLVIVAVIFGFTVHTQNNVDRLSAHPDVRIDVNAFQWQWQFKYPQDHITITGTPTEYPQMVVPVNSSVRLKLSSHDVIHSFYVPGFLYKRDVIPRVDNQIEVDTTKKGTFFGECAEFCGLDHARMGFTVKVVDAGDYERWLQKTQDEQQRRSS
jgi:cytochrome c oxidase subunit II